MLQLNINEIKTHISATLEKVKTGETVIICKRNKPIAQITTLTDKDKSKLKKRIAGYGTKKYPNFKLPDSFNDPLPKEISKYFTGE